METTKTQGQEFMETVDTCYNLNKEKTRYLITFKDGNFRFYRYDRTNETLRREN